MKKVFNLDENITNYSNAKKNIRLNDILNTNI